MLIVLCLGLGLLGRIWLRLPADTPRVLNTWVLWVALPALVIRVVHGVQPDPALLVGAAGLWLVLLVAVAAALVAIRLGVARDVASATALCAGLGNTAFVGIPLLEALGGPSLVGPAAMVDQLGSFLALSLVAVPFATAMGARGLSALSLVRRVVTFPPFLALALAVVLRPVELPGWLDGVLGRLADTMSPLALTSVGFGLDASGLRGHRGALVVGLAYKLVLAPLLVLGLVLVVRGSLGTVERVAVAQAAMAPMVTAGILASEHGLAPRLAVTLIAVGVPLSLLTVPLWWMLLGRLGG